MPVRIYRPAVERSFPTLVYIHGGGWVLGSLDAARAAIDLIVDDLAASFDA